MDWTITLGNILTVIGFVIASVLCVAAVRRDVAVLGTRLGPLEAAVARMVAILEQVGRQDERLKAVERDIERYDPRQYWGKPEPR